MNSLIVLPEECVESGLAVLRGARAEYAYSTHQLRAGVTVRGGIVGRGSGEITVLAATPDEVTLTFTLTRQPLVPHPIDLVVAVPRPQTVKKVIQAATMLGARSLAFVGSESGEKSYLQSRTLEADAIRDEVLKALEQIDDTSIPAISVHRAVWEWIRDSMSGTEGKLLLLAHPGGELPERYFGPTEISHDRAAGVVVAIGPEKGWSTPEVERLTRHGFRLVGLGERVVRVEVALTTLFAQIVLLQRCSLT